MFHKGLFLIGLFLMCLPAEAGTVARSKSGLNIALQQPKEITLKVYVTYQSGNSVIGVTAHAESSSIWGITDISGNYDIRVPQGSKVVYSYIRHKTVSRVVTASSTVNITLQEDMEVIDEVVVMAYRGTEEGNPVRFGELCLGNGNSKITSNASPTDMENLCSNTPPPFISGTGFGYSSSIRETG